MFELTALQMRTVERLLEAGFQPIAIPPYENALCLHRGEFAAVLAPVPNGGLKLLAPVTVLVDGNLSSDRGFWPPRNDQATKEDCTAVDTLREERSGQAEGSARAT